MGRRWLLWAGLLFVGAGALLVLWAWLGPGARVDAPPSPSPEPIIPTQTPTTAGEAEGLSTGSSPSPEPIVSTARASATAAATEMVETQPAPETTAPSDDLPSSSPTATGPAPEPGQGSLYEGRPRWGVGVALGPISRYDVGPLRLGWYLNWGAQVDPARPGGAQYAQMVRLKGGVLRPDAGAMAGIARANPGSLWLIGNEPDVRWQDNVEPAVYARLYHEAYSAIKGADPTAEVAVGGVTQPTPLRLRYLNQVLAAYEQGFGAAMPVDVWNVHNFILREERGSWGVDIPPGLADDEGMLYEVDECDDMAIFRQQIVDFRRWMAEHGYRDKPLIVSEYGIPMPEDYGFPPERVVGFLADTFDFFLTASDPALGYAGDDYRLVQRWCWFSLDAPEGGYPTGDFLPFYHLE
ncbi:MAG: hypothetical protein R6X31_13795 [Anaerolineae bacterium]